MGFSASKVMNAISPILNDPLAGKGAYTLTDLVHDRLIAMEAADAPPVETPPKKKKGRGPNKPKPAQANLLGDDQGGA
jgi:hypothetical protein